MSIESLHAELGGIRASLDRIERVNEYKTAVLTAIAEHFGIPVPPAPAVG